jgi:hypothetical protein
MNSLSLNSSLSHSNIQHLKLAGKFYGYPSCCIKSFISTSIPNRTASQLLVHNGSGFIPCPECAEKIIMGQTTLEQLITNRFCSTEFSSKNIQTSLSRNPEWIFFKFLTKDTVIHL